MYDDNTAKKRKIGILGGTFNPIHIGHLILAQNSIEYCKLDEIIFIPSGISYFKEQKNMTSAYDRYKMTELAIVNNENFSVLDIEIKREGNSYTYETLLELNNLYNNCEFYLIFGADILFTIETWKNPQIIFENANIICAKRDSYVQDEYMNKIKELEEKYGAKIILMSIPELDISSTFIRDSLKAGKSCKYYLNDSVIEYIKEHKLYEV